MSNRGKILNCIFKKAAEAWKAYENENPGSQRSGFFRDEYEMLEDAMALIQSAPEHSGEPVVNPAKVKALVEAARAVYDYPDCPTEPLLDALGAALSAIEDDLSVESNLPAPAGVAATDKGVTMGEIRAFVQSVTEYDEPLEVFEVVDFLRSKGVEVKDK